MSNKKITPQNIEAEQSLLGSLMIDKDAMIRIADLVRAEDFYKDSHGEIYAAMIDLFAKHEPIDILSLSSKLEERKKLDELLAVGFVDMYRNLYPDKVAYTWFSNFASARERNIGWRIDYHFVSATLKNQVKDSRVQLDVMGSDHCPIELIL